jgi:DNA-binding beta-propeller fold protein YncE
MSFKPDIDPTSGKVDAPIALGGAPEFLATDGKGKIYINLEDKNEVAVVDFKAGKVIARWPVAPGGAPVGMAIDTKTRRLFIGCRKPQKLIVMSADNGKVLSDLPIGAGVDATKVDAGHAFASCRDGSLAVASETSPGKFEIVQTVKTPQGARTMGVDPTTHRIYLPTAEFEEPKPGATGRPAMKPGTFMIVVVAPQ